MKTLFKSELKQIVRDKRVYLFFALLTIVSLYFVQSGINEFERFQRDKEAFIQSEKERIPLYVNYKQYSGYGFRVLLEPSPLHIFFKNSTVLSNVEGNVDNTQIVKIFNLFKGRRLFYVRGYYYDFARLFFLLGSIFMLYMGVTGIRSMEWLQFTLQYINLKRFFFMSTAARLLVLNFHFIIVIVLALVYAMANPLYFSEQEISNYFLYGAFTLASFNLFYFIGTLLAVWLKFKKIVFTLIFVVWFFLTFLLPVFQSSYSFGTGIGKYFSEMMDTEKLEHLMEFEEGVQKTFESVKEDNVVKRKELHKKAIDNFLDSYQTTNRSKEAQITNMIKKTIYSYETQALLFPTLFHHCLSAEVSSKGYYGFLDFKDYLITLMEGFSRFYFNRHYIQRKKEIESYAKNDEIIFKARSYIPSVYWPAIALTFGYSLLLLFAGYFLLKRRVKEMNGIML